MCLTFPELSMGTLLLQICPVVFFRLTFPHFHLWCLPWSVLAQWCVSSNLSCPSKRNQDEMAGALGHPPMRYLNHQHTNAYIIAGRFCESRGMEEGLRTAEEYKRERKKKALGDPATKRERSCINHDATLGRQPPLHQLEEDMLSVEKGSSQYSWIYCTTLVLLEGSEEEGLWLPVQAARHTSHEIAHGKHRTLKTALLTWSAPQRDAFVTEKLKPGPRKILNLNDRQHRKEIHHGKSSCYGVFIKS